MFTFHSSYLISSHRILHTYGLLKEFTILTGLSTFVIKYVLRPAILRDSSLFSPYAGSTSNSPFKKLNVFSDIWTRLKEMIELQIRMYVDEEREKERDYHYIKAFLHVIFNIVKVK